MGLLTREDWRVDDVVDVIRGDPGLVVEVLNFANAGKAESEYCDSVERAAVSIGAKKLHAVCLSRVVRLMFGPSASGSFSLSCFRHSRAVAFAAQCLASSFGIDPSRAYTAGLLHNVGLLALLSSYAQEYRDLLAVSAADPANILESEKKLFDIDHCEAGAWLCRHWELPADFELIAARHHCREPVDRSLLSLVLVAIEMADGAGHDIYHPQTVCTPPIEPAAQSIALSAGLASSEARQAAVRCFQTIKSGATLA